MTRLSGLRFLLKYLKNPMSVGAVLPSSKFLAAKMMAGIDFSKAKCIVEYGPGTGVFTDEIIKHRNPGTPLLLIERDPGFFILLSEKYNKEQDLFIVNGSAGDVAFYLKAHGLMLADYIVSGLPFASFPTEVSEHIFHETREILCENGEFITFQYTRFRMGLIKSYFTKITLTWEFRNVPPAYVLRCLK